MKFLLRASVVASACSLAAAHAETVPPVSEQLDDPYAPNVKIIGHVLEPKKGSAEDHASRVAVPPGFEVNVFAEELINPRMIAVADDGTVYVTRRSVGDVIMLRDTDGDGVADEKKVVANRPGMHGIVINGRVMYLATSRELYRTTIQPDRSLSSLQLLADDLPDGAQHPNRTMAIGPDGMLYLSIGSSCNACDETNPEHATMLIMRPDGSERKIFATGLRNTVGFAFEPETKALWGMDHGTDWLGDNEQHEELNHIVKGRDYGWPYIYDDGKFYPQGEPPENITFEEWAAKSVYPIGFYTPHAAPMQMAFYTGDKFPEEYRGDAFVAMRGSWNRKPPAGYEVARIRFNGGRPVGLEAFAQGWLTQQGEDWVHYGRLAGLAQASDGSLLVSDDTNGIIYRISYTGGETNQPPVGPPTNSDAVNIRITDNGSPTPVGETTGSLSSNLVSAQQPDHALALTSPAFADGAPIPTVYTAYGEDISPPLKWNPGPEGTASYVIIMEDPDAVRNPPFVHWLAYNIPGDVTHLPEGVPPEPEIPKPEGTLQGKNDRGSIGYFGPKPPPRFPAHNYHFQVFALDKKLDISFGATRDELVAAMDGHVLSSSVLVGTYTRQ